MECIVIGAVVVLGLLFSSAYALAKPPPASSNAMKDKNLRRKAKTLGINHKGFYHLAIVGASGVGKSTLRNRILGICDDNDRLASPVNYVECTKVPSRAFHPKSSYVTVWDFPGMGTPNHPAETYYDKKGLFAFDSLILVTANRITQNDIALAKQARGNNVPVFFVINKVKLDIKAAKKRQKNTHPAVIEKVIAEQVCRDLKIELQQKLNAEGIFASNIYCIEAWELTNSLLDGRQLLQEVGAAMATNRAGSTTR